MATAGNQALTTSPVDLYRDTGGSRGCTSFGVECVVGAATTALVNVEGLHASDEWFPISAGSYRVFRAGDGGIKRVRAKGDGGSSEVNYGIVSQTR